jgi:hypothetical protein
MEYLDDVVKSVKRQVYIAIGFIVLTSLLFTAYTYPVKYETEEVLVVQFMGHLENRPKYQAVIELSEGGRETILFENNFQIKVGMRLLVEKKTSLFGKSSYLPIKVIE